MQNERSGKSVIAAFLMVAGLFLSTNYAIQNKPLRDWWLPAGLFIVGVALGLPLRQRQATKTASAPIAKANPAEAIQKVREHVVSAPAKPEAQPAATVPKVETPVEEKITTPEAKPVVEASVEPEAKLVVEAAVEPEAKPVVESPKAQAEKKPLKTQDLVRIDGIGPKIANVLIAAKIDTFEKLAAATEDTLRDTLTDAGIRLAPTLPTWAEQATYAARGDWAGMDALNAERKAKS